MDFIEPCCFPCSVTVAMKARYYVLTWAAAEGSCAALFCAREFVTLGTDHIPMFTLAVGKPRATW